MALKEIARTDWSALPAGYFSPSQAWAMISCPACFEAERILRIPKPVSADLMIGRFVHASLARMRGWLLDPNRVPMTLDAIDVEDSMQAGSDAFDEVIARQVDVDDEGDETPIEIELTKKYTDLGEAKDAAVRLTRFALPKIAAYDRRAGVVAAEARVRHLGPSFHGYPELFTKMSAEEQADAQEESEEQFVGGVVPCFPFPVKAFLDVQYATKAIKDAKTSSRAGAPDNLARIQICMYGMPWYYLDEPIPLGFDVMVKTKNPDCRTYWLKSEVDPSLAPGYVTREEMDYVRWRVLKAADDICAGDFPPNDGSLFCKYTHGLPGAEPAANWPGMEIAV